MYTSAQRMCEWSHCGCIHTLDMVESWQQTVVVSRQEVYSIIVPALLVAALAVVPAGERAL